MVRWGWVGWHLQHTEGEDDRDTELLLPVHLEIPDRLLGKDQDDAVRNQLEGSRDRLDSVGVNALSRNPEFPLLFGRDAG